MANLIANVTDSRLSTPGNIFIEMPEIVYTVPVTIASGLSLTRGTVLGKKTADGLYYVHDKTVSDGLENITGVLVDDVDATSGNAKGEMYVHGVFNLLKLPNITNYATSPLLEGYYNSGMIIIKEAQS